MDKRNMDSRKLLWLFKKHFDTHLITFETPVVFFNLLINNIFFLDKFEISFNFAIVSKTIFKDWKQILLTLY